jgi:hypothetical protein
LSPSPSSIRTAPSPLATWLSAHHLKHYLPADSACLHRLAGIPEQFQYGGPRVVCTPECSTSARIFDHHKRFSIGGGKHGYAGLLAAPYLTAAELEPQLERIARLFCLRYRVGNPVDDYYGNTTTSVLLWNPRLVAFEDGRNEMEK